MTRFAARTGRTSPQWGEVEFRAERGIRVRGFTTDVDPIPLTRLTSFADLSPKGRGDSAVGVGQ
jgi:hypothetical protein